MKESPAATLLLSNLRLLDLPELLDVPINTETFTLGRNKAKAFEHIIHHLLNLYNPEECNNRFAGNWPVYEPAQSKNVRAIVVAWLSDLKRTGALQGNAILRKTLFDDCQGERYEELMLAVSNMVLRTIMERGTTKQSIVYELCNQPLVLQDQLQVLQLAYQSSLQRMLKQRADLQTTWMEFAKDIHSVEARNNEKESVIRKACSIRPNLELSLLDIQTRWQRGWIGDDDALSIIMHGTQAKDKTESTTFENALKSFQQSDSSRTTSHDQNSANLSFHDRLQQDLAMSKQRCSQWNEVLTNSTSQESGRSSDYVDSSDTQKLLLLNKHQVLLSRSSNKDLISTIKIPRATIYDHMFADLELNLKEVKTSRTRSPRPDQHKQAELSPPLSASKVEHDDGAKDHRAPESHDTANQSLTSVDGPLELDPSNVEVLEHTPQNMPAADIKNGYYPPTTTKSNIDENESTSFMSDDEKMSEFDFDGTNYVQSPLKPSRSKEEKKKGEHASPMMLKPKRSESNILHGRYSISFDESMIDNIVQSIATAQDSPVKLVYKSDKPIPRPYSNDDTNDDDDEISSARLDFESEDMLEETSSRVQTSIGQQIPDNNESLHVEEYASVFKSRPRIAVSPNMTPSRGPRLDF